METVCEVNQCTGCMACVDACPKNAIKIEDTYSSYNAVIKLEKCINCGICNSVCQVLHKPECVEPISWKQGWIENPSLRSKSSSGGAARAICDAFIKEGGIVYSCVFKDGRFVYDNATCKEEIGKFTGSKYVKSNPKGVYNQIKAELKNGKKILFIGLPCHVGALKNFVGTDENLLTVDLICHGTPSPQLLDIYLYQQGINMHNLEDISFRKKADFRLTANEKYANNGKARDSYSIAFLDGLMYTENCYSCYYANKKRVSDITIGDSWGSNLNATEQKKGISLVLCQTAKGEELLRKADFHEEDVDLNRAIASNHQLYAPVKKQKNREKFFKGIKKQQGFDYLVRTNMPIMVIKQYIKLILLGWGGGVNKYRIKVTYSKYI